jgi:hypothetical protein
VISDEELKGFSDLTSERVFITAKVLKEMATEIMQFRQEKRDNLQCWLAEDRECGPFEEQRMAEEIADNLEDGGSTTEEILCSTLLPNRHMRVWLTGGEERDVHFEWVEKS